MSRDVSCNKQTKIQDRRIGRKRYINRVERIGRRDTWQGGEKNREDRHIHKMERIGRERHTYRVERRIGRERHAYREGGEKDREGETRIQGGEKDRKRERETCTGWREG